MSIREAIITRVMEAGGRLTVRSALNPILWLCAIITAPALLVIGFKADPSFWLILLACTPMFTAIIGFLFLLIFDRDKLQSETYQIRKMELEIIEQKGQSIPIEATAVEVIANPANPVLLAGEIEDGQ